jgi:hypothetical protein
MGLRAETTNPCISESMNGRMGRKEGRMEGREG